MRGFRIGKVGIAMAIVSGVYVLAFVVIALGFGSYSVYREPDPERIYRAGPSGPAYFSEDFEDPPHRLVSMQDDDAYIGVVAGEYRIRLEPASSAQLIRTSGEEVADVEVEATFEQASGFSSAMFGIGCFVGAERGYFLMMKQDGRAVLGFLGGQVEGRDLTPMVTRNVLDPEGPNRLRIACVGDEQGVTVGAWINDAPVVVVADPTGPASFIGVGVGVFAPRGITLHVDDLVARPVDVEALGELPTEILRDRNVGAYARNGVSFTYPEGWTVRRAGVRILGRVAVIWSVTSWRLGGSRHDGLEVMASFAGDATPRQILTSRLELYADALDGTPHDPRAVVVGGVQSSEGTVDGYSRGGRALELRLVVLVRDGIAYQLSCQLEPDDEATAAGCQEIVDSFRLVGG